MVLQRSSNAIDAALLRRPRKLGSARRRSGQGGFSPLTFPLSKTRFAATPGTPHLGSARSGSLPNRVDSRAQSAGDRATLTTQRSLCAWDAALV